MVTSVGPPRRLNDHVKRHERGSNGVLVADDARGRAGGAVGVGGAVAEGEAPARRLLLLLGRAVDAHDVADPDAGGVGGGGADD